MGANGLDSQFRNRQEELKHVITARNWYYLIPFSWVLTFENEICDKPNEKCGDDHGNNTHNKVCWGGKN